MRVAVIGSRGIRVNNLGKYLPDGGQTSLPFEFFYKEGCPMVTYEALFQYTLVIIGIITLIITVLLP